MKISVATYALWQKALTKISERSSVVSYVGALVTALLKDHQAEVPVWVTIICGTASILLFLLSDGEVKTILTGEKP